jgi:hypothetical protein
MPSMSSSAATKTQSTPAARQASSTKYSRSRHSGLAASTPPRSSSTSSSSTWRLTRAATKSQLPESTAPLTLTTVASCLLYARTSVRSHSSEDVP